MDQLKAVRSGKWKLFVAMESKKRNWGKPEGTTPIKLAMFHGEFCRKKAQNPQMQEETLTGYNQNSRKHGLLESNARWQ